MTPLTARQSEVLRTIARLLKKRGYPPTVSELASALNVTTTAVHDHLLALKKKGRVDWTRFKSRTLRVL
jgi:repressor LexA